MQGNDQFESIAEGLSYFPISKQCSFSTIMLSEESSDA